MILSGANRYRACLEAGVTPVFTEFAGESVVAFVLSANLHRRHLSAGQQAAIVASATDWQASQPQGRPNKAATLPVLSTVADRAEASGASERTQRHADKLVREAPELAKQVTQGEKSLHQAIRESKPAKPRQDTHQARPEPMETDSATEALDEANDRAHDLTLELEAYMVAAGENGKDVREIIQQNGLLSTITGQRDSSPVEWEFPVSSATSSD